MDKDREWLVAPDEARISIAIGPEAKVSPEVMTALRGLLEAIEAGGEVEGYSWPGCMTKIVCTVVTTTLCEVKMECSQVGIISL